MDNEHKITAEQSEQLTKEFLDDIVIILDKNAAQSVKLAVVHKYMLIMMLAKELPKELLKLQYYLQSPAEKAALAEVLAMIRRLTGKPA